MCNAIRISRQKKKAPTEERTEIPDPALIVLNTDEICSGFGIDRLPEVVRALHLLSAVMDKTRYLDTSAE